MFVKESRSGLGSGQTMRRIPLLIHEELDADLLTLRRTLKHVAPIPVVAHGEAPWAVLATFNSTVLEEAYSMRRGGSEKVSLDPAWERVG